MSFKVEKFDATKVGMSKGDIVRHMWYRSAPGDGKDTDWHYLFSIRVTGGDGTDPLGAEKLLVAKVTEAIKAYMQGRLDFPRATYLVTGS